MKRFQIGVAALILSIAVAAVWAQQPQPTQPRPAQSGQLQPPAGMQPRPEQVPPAAAPKTAAVATTAVPGLATDTQKASYGIGLKIGRDMRDELPVDDLDLKALLHGLSDSLTNSKPAIDPKDLTPVITEFAKQAMAHSQERAKLAADKNKKEGPAFLAANKTKEGVKTTASGLQYKVIKSGNGAKPTDTDLATVNYKGSLLDGTVFDSSYDRNEPATFPVSGNLIKGWTEALKLMKVGDKWQLFVPADLAYGEEGRAPKIGPNAVLVFDLELLDVTKDPGSQIR